MSQNRFGFLQVNLSFDEEESCADRWKTDRFAAFREVFELFNVQCSRHVFPSEYMCIDETLYPMRNQIALRQYNKQKPAKYGLLVRSLNDSRFPFTYKAIPCAGKLEDVENAHYYLLGIESYVKQLVESTEKDVSLQGRCITMDRLYTMISTANWLLS